MSNIMTAVRIEIDYPQEREKISSRHYSVRVTAPEAQKVLVSIDDSQFHLCRQADGFFWFDLQSLRPGAHDLVAKALLPNGDVAMSDPRKFRVDYY